MKKHSINFVIVSLACLTVASLVGSSFGTLAWYAYVTRATVSYQGTAVQKTEQLQIGLLWGSNTAATDATMEGHGAVYTVIGDSSYYFMPTGKGFSSTAINYYLSKRGHATNELAPVTSGTYAYGDDLSLYEAPMCTYEDFAKHAADDSRYVDLPLAFRVVTNEGTFVPDAKIWLTDVLAEAAGDSDVEQAIRIYNERLDVDDEYKVTDCFLLRPATKEGSGGSTYVAGVLDLDNDGYYDYDKRNLTEYVYGEKTIVNRTPHAFDADSALDDINDTNREGSDSTTFRAKHKAGVSGYYESYGSDVERDTADYLSFAQVRPEEDPYSGDWINGHPLAITGTTNRVARCNFTIYLEGWDHAIVDQLLDEDGKAPFNLGLQFEINRVQ